MSGNNEPTDGVSRPDKHDTAPRTGVEQKSGDNPDHAEAAAVSNPSFSAEENELLAFILTCVSDAVFALDTSGVVVLCNRAAELLCGKTEREVRGKRIDDVILLVNEKTL
ncbi:MAG: PAS domain-containing protein, partial [Chitinispirillaceae bacterium]|nr:PAS domain-containing protein [Chitinispirillaceae bacterium]